ncbi:hypothetical protein LCGC14_2100560 [marine sediment metagenome]|uniref:Uncharacterized protein n=2 Tax=root TaxID=1 RepID=A0A831QJ98_9FLAO|nr:hypothetical protein [Pricia antarctica]
MKYRWVKWHDDKWLSRQGSILPWDKAEHAIVSAILAYFATLLLPLLAGCLLVLFIGSLWELKDSIMPWEKYGFWGGDGFSWKDLIADFVGILIIFIIKF